MGSPADCVLCRDETPASLTVTYGKEAYAGIRRDTLTPRPTLWRWAPSPPPSRPAAPRTSHSFLAALGSM